MATATRAFNPNEEQAYNSPSEVLGLQETNQFSLQPSSQRPPDTHHPFDAASNREKQKVKFYNGLQEGPTPANPEAWRTSPVGTAPVRNLLLKDQDQRHRVTGAPTSPGYCVDELCSCYKHQCLPGKKPTPFEGQTVYRTEYTPKPFESLDAKGKQALTYGPDGVPYGVNPEAWKDYVAKHGIPIGDTIPAYLFYRSTPDNRDFTTENRAQYVPPQIPAATENVNALYGPDGVPYGVDPKTWKEYVDKHGLPASDNLPAYLFYKTTPENRDFSTEHRTEYTPKTILKQDASLQKDGVPYGVDPILWKEYIAKHGVPPTGSIPASLFYRSVPDKRDFVTNYRKSYTPYTVSVCPVARLPPYPVPKWPQEHTFWDPVAKTWY